MTAEERYEKTWNSFLIYLNHNPKAHLTAFCQERHVNSRTMQNWMIEKGYSVLRAKQEVRLAGYVTDITETVEEGKPNIITSVLVETAVFADCHFLQEAVENSERVTNSAIEEVDADGN